MPSAFDFSTGSRSRTQRRCSNQWVSADRGGPADAPHRAVCFDPPPLSNTTPPMRRHQIPAQWKSIVQSPASEPELRASTPRQGRCLHLSIQISVYNQARGHSLCGSSSPHFNKFQIDHSDPLYRSIDLVSICALLGLPRETYPKG